MKRAAIFLFYDAQGVVDPYVLKTLSSLRPYFSHIVVVSNGLLSAKSSADLHTHCDHLIERDNTGFDVGGYRTGLTTLGWDRLGDYEEIVLLNNTFYSPLKPWGPIFSTSQAWDDVDFWGLTSHAQVKPHPYLSLSQMDAHIQSHWIALRRTLVTHPSFREYWESMPEIRSYRDSITWHETRFTTYFSQRGFSWRALFPYEQYSTANPCIEEPHHLIADGCPILKRRLFFDSTIELRSVHLRELVEAAGYPLDTVLSGVARLSTPLSLIKRAHLIEVIDDSTCSTSHSPSLFVHIHTGPNPCWEHFDRLTRVLPTAPLVITVPSKQVANEVKQRLSTTRAYDLRLGTDAPDTPICSLITGGTELLHTKDIVVHFDISTSHDTQEAHYLDVVSDDFFLRAAQVFESSASLGALFCFTPTYWKEHLHTLDEHIVLARCNALLEIDLACEQPPPTSATPEKKCVHALPETLHTAGWHCRLVSDTKNLRTAFFALCAEVEETSLMIPQSRLARLVTLFADVNCREHSSFSSRAHLLAPKLLQRVRNIRRYFHP